MKGIQIIRVTIPWILWHLDTVTSPTEIVVGHHLSNSSKKKIHSR